MKIQRKKSFFTRTRVLIILAVLLVVAGFAAWWFFMRQPAGSNDESKINSIDYSPPTEEEKKDSAEAKQRAVGESEQNPETPTMPTSDTLVVTINRASQVAAGQALNIRTQIDGASSGTCEVTLTKSGGATVRKTFDITRDATTITCNGDIAADEFTAAGEWQASIVAKSGGVVSATPATQTVTIQK